MVKIYADLIDKGLRTIDQVPAVWRAAVEEELRRRHPEPNGE
jgi:hypothetical protein